MKLKKLKQNYKKHIIIYIWKINHKKEPFPAFTCSWCAGLIRKYNFPKENVITLNGIKAYKEDYKQPLKKINPSYEPVVTTNCPFTLTSDLSYIKY